MIILASGSPRRAEILQRHGVQFIAEAADIDETPLPDEPAPNYVLRLAIEKAQSRLSILKDRNFKLVLAADTSVVVEETILGKPKSFEDFASMMDRLSGKVHQVHSGVAVISEDKPVDTILATTHVGFRQITEAEILSYWQSGEPKDKAGGYAIQGLAAEFVRSLEGSYSNVVGLPIFETMQLLHEWGIASHLNKASD